MKKTDVLIIGGGPAGIVAGLTIKKIKPKLKVTLVKKEKGVTILCSEPYALAGIVNPKDIVFSDKKMITSAGIDLVIDEAKKIEIKKNIVVTKKNKIKFKKLVLATGARPFVPPIPGKEMKNIFTLRTIKDVKNIRQSLKKAKNIIIVGGGAIGIEVASLLNNKKRKITIIELLPHLVSGAYDEDFSQDVENVLSDAGIKILTNESVKGFLGENKVKYVLTSKKRKIPADIVLLSIGVRSNIDLAKSSGIKIGKFGIWVNKYQQTSVKNIYAIGDCAQAIDFITGKPTPSQLATTAVFQAKVAAMNIIGKKVKYDGVVNPAVSAFECLAIGRVGLTEKQAKENGFKIIVGRAESYNRYACHPNTCLVKIKLIFEKKTKRILGGQIISGEHGVAQRINLLSLAIKKKMTAGNLANLNYCAHPELTPLPFAEPIVMASESVL